MSDRSSPVVESKQRDRSVRPSKADADAADTVAAAQISKKPTSAIAHTADEPRAVVENGERADGAAAEDADDEGKQLVIDPTKDLWANITLNVRDANQEVTEISLLVVGGSGSGKTTLLQRVYSGADGKGAGGGGKKVKPTTALDYSFARRSDRNFSQVAHFWELAQNRQLNSLADIILSPDNIHAVVCTVVVDFFSTEGFASTGSATGAGAGNDEGAFNLLSAWDTAVFWLKRIDSRTSEVLEKMKAKNSSTPAKLMARAQKFCGGSENPDLRRMRLSGLPTVLVVNKVDLFFKNVYSNAQLNYNRDNFTMLVKAFRFLAHLYGCHLIFTAAAPEASGSGSGSEGLNKWRNIMANLLFQTPFESKNVNFDLEKERGAVLVTADKDSFAIIGDAPVSGYGGRPSRAAAEDAEGGAYGSVGDTELEKWRFALEAAFPVSDELQLQQRERAKRGGSDGGAGGGGTAFTKQLYDTYAEPAVDALRRQKDEELEQYRKTARLKVKEAK